jgi:hypothetical protein
MMGFALSRWKEVLGVGLFIGVPFGMGFVASFIASVGRDDISAKRAIGFSIVPVGVGILLLLALGIEGLACVVMALPLLFPLCALGGYAAWATTRAAMGVPSRRSLQAVALPALLVFADIGAPPSPELLTVQREIHVAAPPETVWREVTRPSSIDAPIAPVFAIAPMPLVLGPASPGDGKRALDFTIGRLLCSVNVEDPQRRIVFEVEEEPSNIRRYVHLLRTEVALEPTPDGQTALRATTTYELYVHPTAYWGRWTSAFVGAAQERILVHLARRIESTDRAPNRDPRLPYWLTSSNATCNCTRHAAAGSAR